MGACLTTQRGDDGNQTLSLHDLHDVPLAPQRTEHQKGSTKSTAARKLLIKSASKSKAVLSRDSILDLQEQAQQKPHQHTQRRASLDMHDASALVQASAGCKVNRSVAEGLASILQVQGELGAGCQGKTWLCQDLSTSELWAVKMVKLPLPSYLVQGILREIQIQADLGEGHLNLITPQEVVLTSHYLGLVMEYAPGRSMTQYVSQKWKETRGVGLLMSEDEGLYFFKQLLSAVAYIHRNKVVHRDLKLDNTLLTADDPPYIKLCDFGFACGWGMEADAHFNSIVGTADYMSPQLITAKMGKADEGAQYDGTKADIWALGVLLAVMVLGKFPFEAESAYPDAVGMVYTTQTAHERWRDNPELHDAVQLLSADCISLLDAMLEKEEGKRADIATISAHPWLQRPLPLRYQAALDKLAQEQAELDQKLGLPSSNIVPNTTTTKHHVCAEAAGAAMAVAAAATAVRRRERRNKEIKQLVEIAASDEFKAQATSPVGHDYTFRLFARVGLLSTSPTLHPSARNCMVDRNCLKSLLQSEESRRSLALNDVLARRPGLQGIHWGSSYTTPMGTSPVGISRNPSQTSLYTSQPCNAQPLADHSGSLLSNGSVHSNSGHLYAATPASGAATAAGSIGMSPSTYGVIVGSLPNGSAAPPSVSAVVRLQLPAGSPANSHHGSSPTVQSVYGSHITTSSSKQHHAAVHPSSPLRPALPHPQSQLPQHPQLRQQLYGTAATPALPGGLGGLVSTTVGAGGGGGSVHSSPGAVRSITTRIPHAGSQLTSNIMAQEQQQQGTDIWQGTPEHLDYGSVVANVVNVRQPRVRKLSTVDLSSAHSPSDGSVPNLEPINQFSRSHHSPSHMCHMREAAFAGLRALESLSASATASPGMSPGFDAGMGAFGTPPMLGVYRGSSTSSRPSSVPQHQHLLVDPVSGDMFEGDFVSGSNSYEQVLTPSTGNLLMPVVEEEEGHSPRVTHQQLLGDTTNAGLASAEDVIVDGTAGSASTVHHRTSSGCQESSSSPHLQPMTGQAYNVTTMLDTRPGTAVGVNCLEAFNPPSCQLKHKDLSGSAFGTNMDAGGGYNSGHSPSVFHSPQGSLQLSTAPRSLFPHDSWRGSMGSSGSGGGGGSRAGAESRLLCSGRPGQSASADGSPDKYASQLSGMHASSHPWRQRALQPFGSQCSNVDSPNSIGSIAAAAGGVPHFGGLLAAMQASATSPSLQRPARSVGISSLNGLLSLGAGINGSMLSSPADSLQAGCGEGFAGHAGVHQATLPTSSSCPRLCLSTTSGDRGLGSSCGSMRDSCSGHNNGMGGLNSRSRSGISGMGVLSSSPPLWAWHEGMSHSEQCHALQQHMLDSGRQVCKNGQSSPVRCQMHHGGYQDHMLGHMTGGGSGRRLSLGSIMTSSVPPLPTSSTGSSSTDPLFGSSLQGMSPRSALPDSVVPQPAAHLKQLTLLQRPVAAKAV